jgi:predicted DNA-binding protein with PD1-like motif
VIVLESRQTRRLVGRLDRGQDLHTSILELCREHDVKTAALRALGSFETVELAEYDQAARKWKPSRKLEGGMELLALEGNVSDKGGELALHAHVTVMRDRDSGIEILGGHLVAARIFALELVLDVMDDVILHRAPDPETGLVLWKTVETVERAEQAERVESPEPPKPRPAPVAPATATTWAKVAEASEQKEAAHVEEEGDELHPGDLLNHPTFGRCEVARVEDEFVHVRVKSGRLLRLSLDVIKLFPVGKEDGKRVFRVRVDG